MSNTSGFADTLINAAATVRHWRTTSRYKRFVGGWPNFARPTSYTEKMQYRKAFDRNPLFKVFCDKLKAREYAQTRVSSLKFTDLLWVGSDADEIPFSSFQPPYVIKPNARSGAIAFVRDGETPDVDALRPLCRTWMRKPYSTDEWGYWGASRRLMVERMLPPEPGKDAPVSMNFMTFSGRVEYIRYNSDRSGRNPRTIFDRDWNRLPLRHWQGWKEGSKKAPPNRPEVPRPPQLDLMIDCAERLGEDVDFARVDLYPVGQDYYFGELTPYDGSGFNYFYPEEAGTDPFPPRVVDYEMGALWIDMPSLSASQMLRRLLGFRPAAQ